MVRVLPALHHTHPYVIIGNQYSNTSEKWLCPLHARTWSGYCPRSLDREKPGLLDAAGEEGMMLHDACIH